MRRNLKCVNESEASAVMLDFGSTYKVTTLGRDPQGLHFSKLESPGPKDVPCQTLMHLCKCFIIEIFLRCLLNMLHVKLCPLRA